MDESKAALDYSQKLLFTIKPPRPQVVSLTPTIREQVVAKHVQNEFTRIALAIRDTADKIHRKTEQYKKALDLLANYSRSSIDIEIDVARLQKQQEDQQKAVKCLQEKQQQVCAGIDEKQRDAERLLADVEVLNRRLVELPQ